MRISHFTVILVAVTFGACNNKSVQVLPLQNTTNVAGGIVYSLPRSAISINVDVERSATIPGPYAAYAQKYLGITGVATQKTEEYSILSIHIGVASETDPNAMFLAFLKDKSLNDFFHITNSGLVLPLGDFKTISATNNNLPRIESYGINFKDLSNEPFIAEEKSTFYSSVQRDSTFVRVPVQRSMIVEKNIEEKAKDASDFIFSLRKKKVEFMTIDVDHPFDGDALKLMFAEIDRLEKEYLSLFIGKSYSEKSTKTILYIPTKPEGETSIVFRYSPSKGIVGPNDLSGNPILIEIEPEATPEAYSSFSALDETITDKNRFDQIYYRIPINALVKISDGKNELANRRLLIYQYGPTVKLPLKHLLISK